MSALRTRRAALRRGSEPSPERRLVSLIRVVLLFESALYSAVTPILPHYAAHPARLQGGDRGTGGGISGRPDPGRVPRLLGRHPRRRPAHDRRSGWCGFGLAVIAFGFGTSIVMLDVLRAIQGMFCGLIWCGGLTWVIHVTPVQRRSRTLGGVLGAATFGTLFGPIIGTVAVAIGTGPAFALVGLIALALAAVTLRHPEPPASSSVDPERTVARSAARRLVEPRPAARRVAGAAGGGDVRRGQRAAAAAALAVRRLRRWRSA